MKLVVGLGNPGSKYEATRHNIGFDIVDALLARHGLKMTEQKFRADYTIWHVGGEKVLLVKPYTFMNLSGEALLPLMLYYNVSPDDILVVFDDLDLAPGTIRLKQMGSAGGHNGIKNIIALLDTQTFKRIKIGIGRPQQGRKVIDHVLQTFMADDRVLVDGNVTEAVDAIEKWVSGVSFIELMNQYNGKQSIK